MCLPLRDLETLRLVPAYELYGMECEVTHNGLGNRCGYLRVMPGHPWFGRRDMEVPASVHGGITFAHPGKACPTHDEKAEWWVGFDCGHAGDASDPSLPGFMEYCGPSDYRTIRTLNYVQEEVRRLAEQAYRVTLAQHSPRVRDYYLRKVGLCAD